MSTLLQISSPRESGGRPSYQGHAERQGLYMLWMKCWFSAIIYGGSNDHLLINICIYAAFSWWYNKDVEDRMSKFDFKKVTAFWNRRFWRVTCILSDWVNPNRKVPPNFGPVRIVRFWKVRAFWKAYVLENVWSNFRTPPHWNSKFPPF